MNVWYGFKIVGIEKGQQCNFTIGISFYFLSQCHISISNFVSNIRNAGFSQADIIPGHLRHITIWKFKVQILH